MEGRWGVEHRGLRKARRGRETKGVNVRELITPVIAQQVPPERWWGGGESNGEEEESED